MNLMVSISGEGESDYPRFFLFLCMVNRKFWGVWDSAGLRPVGSAWSIRAWVYLRQILAPANPLIERTDVVFWDWEICESASRLLPGPGDRKFWGVRDFASRCLV